MNRGDNVSEFDMKNSIKWWDGLIDLQPRQLAQTAFVGAVTGVVAWFMTLLIRQIVMVPLLCGDAASQACASATNNAGIVAAVFAAVVGLLGLVRLSAYRPLLIVLASAVTLWGLGDWLSSAPWYEALAWSVVLYGLSFAAFAWLVRPRAFAPALAATVIVVLLARLVAS